MEKKKDSIVNARKIIKMRCITGIIVCSIVIALTFVALVFNTSDFYGDKVEAGLGTFKMFTTLSNILAAIAAFICIPFQIDGLRRDRYKLPAWIVFVMYIGVVGVFLTFSIAITLISFSQGFAYAMFAKSNLFLHTINPLIITILFTFVISDSRIKFKQSLFALIPVLAYALLYGLLVFVLHVWNDHYQTNTIIPWYLSFILVMSVAFGVTQLVAFLHNKTNEYVTKNIERYYLKSPDYEFEKLPEAIKHLAEHDAKYYFEGDDITIPVDTIKLLSKRYSATNIPIDILYDIYLENYLIKIKDK